LRDAVNAAASPQGGVIIDNECALLIAEYNARQSLRKLGYPSDPKELNCFKAECFLIIQSELQKIEEERMNSGHN
jgi:hypothetical protein